MKIRRILASAPREHDLGPQRPLYTPWGEALDPSFVRMEHPRPQFARDNFIMLNGWWEYSFVSSTGRRTTRMPDVFEGSILVPFSPESLLSGVGRQLTPDQLMWYARTVALPPLNPGDRCILHFEAVDFSCGCCVNGELVGTHRGGYLPFSFDITEEVRKGWDEAMTVGEYAPTMTLSVCVWDPSDTGTQPRGKQKLDAGGIWYTAQSGIWQPVWMEVVPERHFEALRLGPDAANSSLTIDMDVRGEAGPVRLCLTDERGQVAVDTWLPLEQHSVPVAVENDDGSTVTPFRIQTMPLRRMRVTVPVPYPQLWSPEEPHLYYLTLQYDADVVHSYTAFRTVTVEKAGHGRARFCLNGKPYLLRGVLDQGYWSDGLMTAPSDEAMVYDIMAMKEAGFNMLRKHIKVEADRWYYHCDRLGMLVWQDMVSGGGEYDQKVTSFKPTLSRHSWGRYDDTTEEHQQLMGSASQRYQTRWTQMCTGTVEHLANHPCIATWVLFNEAWGQFDAARATEMVHRLDPTRPIDAVSGWYDQHCGDYLSVHNYFRRLKVYRDSKSALQGYVRGRKGGRAFAISEFGGVVYHVPAHSAFATSYGYATCKTLKSWKRAVLRQLKKAARLWSRGLSGYVYTQLSDVEEEVNGFLTYDRRVNKLKG